MIDFSRKILLCIAVLIGLVPVVAGGKKKVDDNTALKSKADYIFVEAMKQKEAGNIDSFYELLRHAHAVDSSNSAVSYYLGFSMLIKENAKQSDAEKGVDLMRRLYEKHPENFYEVFNYANMLQHIGKNKESLAAWERLATIYPTKIDVQGELADSYARNGDFRKAIASFDSIEGVLGPLREIYLRKISFYYQLKDTVGMLKEGYGLLRTAPQNADYNIFMGNVFQSIQETDSAEVYYDKAIKFAPDNGRAYLSKANIYMLRGDSVNYDKQIYNALTSQDLDVENKVEVLTDYIKQLFARRDTSERINRLFQVLLRQHPHEVAIHDLYSQYFVARDKYTEAAEQLGYVVDIDPSNAEYWKKLMMVNLMAEHYPEAIEAAEKSLEYNPDNFELYQYIGPAYYSIKEYDKALDVYDRCLARADSTDYELISNVEAGRGDVYYALSDTAKAFACYEKAIELNPTNVSVMNNYAYFLAVEGRDLDRAERMSAKAVNSAPDNPTFLDTYAWVYFKKGDYSLALAYIEYAIKNEKGESAELMEHYGDILFMNGRYDDAVVWWEKALKLNPDSEILNRKVKNKTYFNK